MQTDKIILTLLLASYSLWCVPAARANFAVDLGLTAGHENNLGRGFYAQDIHDSAYLGSSINGSKLFQPGLNTSLIFSASLGASRFIDNSGFNRRDAGIAIGSVHKFGMGAYSTQLGITLSADREFSVGAERDRSVYSLQTKLSKRFGPDWSGEAFLARETSRGDNERSVHHHSLPYNQSQFMPMDPFDYSNNVAGIRVDYDFSNGWLLSSAYQFSNGNIVSSGLPPLSAIFAKARAVAWDPAFHHLNLLYLLKSKTHSWSETLSIPVTRDTAIDFSYSWHNIDALDVGTYKNSAFALTLIHQF